MHHPVQALAAVDALVITACDSTLSCFDLSTSTEIATSTPHTALVRSLATFTDESDSTSYLISTGEDKQLVVSRLPSLEIVSKRELVKRANAIEVTKQGEIVVGDKFGDVYTFPLHPPASEATPAETKADGKKAQPEYAPILGHVSMLNTLALLDQPGESTKQYIATGDRDEHVRVSRFPLGHVIEGFLWGSKHFVSSLLYLPSAAPSTSSSSPNGPLLLSAGGDPTIQVFSLSLPASTTNGSTPVGSLVAQYPIEAILVPTVVVAPVLPDPVPAGRKKDKKGKSRSNGAAAAEGEGEAAQGEAGSATVEGEQAQEEEEEKKELKTGLAVIKMVQVGGKGIIVLAAGSTALVYIPLSSLLSSSSPSSSTTSEPGPHSLVTFEHPVLDFVPLPIPASANSSIEFLVSLDTTRSSSSSASSSSPTSSSPSSPSSSSLVRISLDEATEKLSLLPSSRDLVFTRSIETSQPPSISSLYPVLMMLHHPGDESDLVEGGGAGGGEGTVGDGKPKGGVRAQVGGGGGANGKGKGKKRTSDELEASGEADVTGGGSGRKSGKRAVGRAETLRRWEEAKKKLQGGQGNESLSVGEKEAVKEMELEQAEQAAK